MARTRYLASIMTGLRRVALLAALGAATPAAAERITAYWQLEANPGELAPRTVAFKTPFLTERVLPVRMVRLTAEATPAGGKPVAAGTALILVANAEGRIGFCALKDWSGANQAKTAFIPALDKRPCFADTNGDGAFDASFSVFYAYTLLSPPQPRGSINAAVPMARPAAYAVADVHDYPTMTLTYSLLPGKTAAKIRLRATMDRPGHNEWTDLYGAADGAGAQILALGTVIRIRTASPTGAEIEIQRPPSNFIVAMDRGTIWIPELPAAVARELR